MVDCAGSLTSVVASSVSSVGTVASIIPSLAGAGGFSSLAIAA